MTWTFHFLDQLHIFGMQGVNLHTVNWKKHSISTDRQVRLWNTLMLGFGVCFHSTNRISLFFILLAVKVHFVFHFEYDSMSNYCRISVHRFIYCGAQRKSEIHWTIFCTHRGYFSICKCIFRDRRFALRRFHISTIWWMVFSSACLAFTWFEFLFSCRSSV